MSYSHRDSNPRMEEEVLNIDSGELEGFLEPLKEYYGSEIELDNLKASSYTITATYIPKHEKPGKGKIHLKVYELDDEDMIRSASAFKSDLRSDARSLFSSVFKEDGSVFDQLESENSATAESSPEPTNGEAAAD